MEDLSASVSLSCCVADVRETTASLFAKTPDVRHQAIASPDVGQGERSKWNALDIFRRAGVRKVHAANEGAMEMLVMEQVKLGMEKRGFWTAVDPQCDIRVCP